MKKNRINYLILVYIILTAVALVFFVNNPWDVSVFAFLVDLIAGAVMGWFIVLTCYQYAEEKKWSQGKQVLTAIIVAACTVGSMIFLVFGSKTLNIDEMGGLWRIIILLVFFQLLSFAAVFIFLYLLPVLFQDGTWQKHRKKEIHEMNKHMETTKQVDTILHAQIQGREYRFGGNLGKDYMGGIIFSVVWAIILFPFLWWLSNQKIAWIFSRGPGAIPLAALFFGPMFFVVFYLLKRKEHHFIVSFMEGAINFCDDGKKEVIDYEKIRKMQMRRSSESRCLTLWYQNGKKSIYVSGAMKRAEDQANLEIVDKVWEQLEIRLKQRLKNKKASSQKITYKKSRD